LSCDKLSCILLDEFPHSDLGIHIALPLPSLLLHSLTAGEQTSARWRILSTHVFFYLIFNLAPEVFLAPQLTIYGASEPTDPDHSSGITPDNDAKDGRLDFVIMAASIRHRDLTNTSREKKKK